MGMDFRYASSASYPRFDSMIRRIATAFGAVEKPESEEYKNKVEGTLDWWFGTFDRDSKHKFIWPDGTSPTIRDFVEDPYASNDWPEDIYEELKSKFPDGDESYDGEDNIRQIMYELECCIEFGSLWDVLM